MKVLVKKTLILVIGWAFVLLGIAGLFLPFLQGILFILIGLLVLSKESPFARSLLLRFEKRFPDQYQKMHALSQRLKNRFRGFVKG